MSLRTKTTLIVAVTLASLLIVMYASSHYFLLRNYLTLEKYDSVIQITRAENAMTAQIANLDSITADWSNWDETYAFAADHNADFIATNLSDATLKNLQVDLLLCYNSSGQLLYKKTVGHGTAGSDSLASRLDSVVRKHGDMLNQQPNVSIHRGLLILPGQTLLVSARPILNSLGQKPAHGTLLMGRIIDAGFIKRLAETTGLALGLTPYGLWNSSLTPAEQTSLRQAGIGQALTRMVDGKYLQAYAVLGDINANPALVLTLNLPRSIYEQGKTSMNYFLISLLIIGLVFIVLAMLWLEKAILQRLTHLNTELQQIKNFDQVNIRVDIDGNDEISQVGTSINNMLSALEQTHKQLIENDIHLHRITDNMLDTLALVDLTGNIQYCSPSFFTNLGYQPERLIGYSVHELIHPDEKEGIRNTMLDMIDLGLTSTAICRIKHAQGNYIWLESTTTLLRDSDSDQIIGIVIVSRDISQRKAAEDSLIYLSEHDPMTNLYNRIFFRQFVSEIDRQLMPDFGAICCDFNGLRLVNDTMGYQTGDNLIIATAEIMNTCTPSGAITARTGGDEFTMFIPHADISLLDAICRDIGAEIQIFNDEHPDLPLSLSLGCAAGNAKDSIQEKLVEAAGNMYRDKLHQHTSGRSAIVSTLMQALQERDFITSGHADRMEKLVVNMGTVCNLSASQINDLRLLARFHDIGKVGVKDSLLFKPIKLTTEEHKEMQRHCEIGYRIAQAAPHLRHISEWILKHHEWWNGEGYPLGLKGEDIPKECRILAIADAYDAMTNERPYRKPISHEEALEELRRCAGTQFDPWLTVDFICMWQPTENEE